MFRLRPQEALVAPIALLERFNSSKQMWGTIP